ncbi:MAG: UvrD-helicase domain-containing protein [Acidobacteriia bacterium]|nr:UvrD-helicase domain-containing protein [Terriglobia bacterium]
MPPRHLINEDGTPFDDAELRSVRQQLDRLDEDERKQYRNQNAAEVAGHSAHKMLIVSGPGTGKSHLFLDRIDHWFQQEPDARILVFSFVRKLVADLQSDIDNDEQLTDDQKRQTTVSTLHRIARGIVERNHGTSKWSFAPHFRIIGQSWKDIVWADVLAFHPDLEATEYTWRSFERQLHDVNFDPATEWRRLKQTYWTLCQFYNAAGFADLIIRARVALEENPALNENDFFIIDEYQDFNRAEAAFIETLAGGAEGVLVAGDDDQVLYENLKSGDAGLIRSHYNDQDFVNAMLPFCGRCSYHITKSAAHFIQQHEDADSIKKIFLPIETGQGNPNIQVIACATPATAVDYVEQFVEEHQDKLNERRDKLVSGDEKDAFLLILTPAKELRFFRDSGRKLFELVAQYRTEPRSFSEDYYKLLNYYSLARYRRNNFTFRKVLFYEGISVLQVHEHIDEAIQNGQNLCELAHEEINELLEKCDMIRAIVEDNIPLDSKIEKLSRYLQFGDTAQLKLDLETQKSNDEMGEALDHQEEEEAELEEIEVKKMSAVELISIVGAKGLSADHVILVGFDDVNMRRTTKNAFYVALTRARKSLHLLTSLQSGGSSSAHAFLGHLPDAHLQFFSYKKGDHLKTARSRGGFTAYLARCANKVRGR